MPVEEIPVGKKLIEFYGRKPTAVEEIINSSNLLSIETKKPFKELLGLQYPVVCSKVTPEADLCFPETESMEKKEGDKSSFDFTNLKLSEEGDVSNGNLVFKRNYPGIDQHELLLKA